MSTLDTFLTEPMAYYVAGLATADWLIEADPRGIYRWDQFSGSSSQTMANRCKRVAKLGTRFSPICLSDKPTRSETKRARATALNNSFVTLSGIAGLQLIERYRKETVRPLFHLFGSDIERAAGILQPVAKSAGMGTYLAHWVLEETMKIFQRPAIRSVVEDLAEAVLQSGSVTDEHDGLEEFLRGLEDELPAYPQTIIRWPECTSKYVSNTKPQPGPDLGATSGTL